MKTTLAYWLVPLAVFASACQGDSDAAPESPADTSTTEDIAAEDTATVGADQADGTDRSDGADATDGTDDTDGDGPDLSEASFDIRGTLEMLYIWNAPPESEMEVVNVDGSVIATESTDELGSLVIRELNPATDLSVRVKSDPEDIASRIQVMGESDLPPDVALYESQTLVPGNNYITTRDGTKLHIFVSLPGPIEDGPYPTVVNYSGYSPARPGQTLSPLLEVFCDDFPVLCDVPSHGAGIFTGMMGYASVGVNMRGTGCSDGAYDFFEPLQLMDGYDVIETVARQDWVKHNEVGMAGLSYPGIAQLFVAKTQPPSLSAITPMSVLADSASSTLAPGGIPNDGFALSWIDNVLERALPYGHGWIQDVVDGGDELCAEHQKLHGQLVDVVAKALANPYYTDEVAAPLDPSSWADQIDVPVFLTGQWQDEQTGPHFAALLDKFTSSPLARFTVTNGVHIDGFTPQILMEWKTFMDFYIAKEIPSLDAQVRELVPLFYSQLSGVSIALPPNRFEDYTDFETALADYEAEPGLRVIWESGADTELAGAPQGTFETGHTAWPVPETVPVRWFFQPDGTLGRNPPGADGGASDYAHDPEAGIRTTLPEGNIADLAPPWQFRASAPGTAAVFEGEPLDEDVVMLGHGSVDLWFQSTADDADIEVTLTEIRPDGQEVLVQSGWLRASHRALREDATELRPVKTHREEDAMLLPAGEWTEVRVEIMPFGHIFRSGSRIRLTVDTPGDSAARWFFILNELPDGTRHAIAHNADHPSSVVLPIIPDVTVDTPLPECTLRGQPCRTYAPYENTPFE